MAVLVLSANVAFAFLLVNLAVVNDASLGLADANLATSVANIAVQVVFADFLFGFEAVSGMDKVARDAYFESRTRRSLGRGVILTGLVVALSPIVGLWDIPPWLFIALVFSYITAFSVSPLYQYAVFTIGFDSVQTTQLVAIVVKAVTLIVTFLLTRDIVVSLVAALNVQQLICSIRWLFIPRWVSFSIRATRLADCVPLIGIQDVLGLLVLNRDSVQNTIDQFVLRAISISTYANFALIGPFLALARQMPAALVDDLRSKIASENPEAVREARKRFLTVVGVLEVLFAVAIALSWGTLQGVIPVLKAIDPLIGLEVSLLGFASALLATRIFGSRQSGRVLQSFACYGAVALGGAWFCSSIGLFSLHAYLLIALAGSLVMSWNFYRVNLLERRG